MFFMKSGRTLYTSEVLEVENSADEKVKAYAAAAEIFTKEDLDGASVEALKEALEKSKETEKKKEDEAKRGYSDAEMKGMDGVQEDEL